MKCSTVILCLVGALAGLQAAHSCDDRSPASRCQAWKNAGYCETISFMDYYCKKTCGFCGDPNSCGRRPNTRIVGGAEAPKGSWPWQAMIRTTSGFPFCGGSFVTPEWVVTAAHCLPGKKPQDLKIRLGAHYRLHGSVGTEQDFSVAKLISHPSYDSPKQNSYDIALVKLAKPAILSNSVGTVCLPDASSAPLPFRTGKRCWISGWGRLASGGASPDVLMQASVPLVSRCNVGYPGKIDNTMLCAGFDKGGIDACQGDSGGPLVCESGGKWYLEGATSWGYGCAQAMRYGVYANIRYLNKWLKETMSKN